MAYDRREDILNYIHTVILQEVANASGGFAYRDRGDIEPVNPETQVAQLPGLILLDGKESQGVSTRGHGGSGGLIPTVMVMQPQIYVALKPRDTSANEGVGPELSAWRMRILKAIDQDDSLRAKLGSNGEMSYDGLDSDMHADGPMVGQEAMNFTFVYTFNPREF